MLGAPRKSKLKPSLSMLRSSLRRGTKLFIYLKNTCCRYTVVFRTFFKAACFSYKSGCSIERVSQRVDHIEHNSYGCHVSTIPKHRRNDGLQT